MPITRTIICILITAFSLFSYANKSIIDESKFLPIGSKEGANNVGVGGYIGNELYSNYVDKNKIFKEADLKLDIGFGDFVNLETKWSRRVFNFHEINTEPTYKPNDLSKFIVVNSIFAKIGAGTAHSQLGFPVGIGAEYGILFSVGQLKIPRDSQEGSPYDNRNAPAKLNAEYAKNDLNTLFLKNDNCFTCDQSKSIIQKINKTLKNIWLKSIGLAENVIDFIIQPFIDSEKIDEYNQEPMKALKLQAIFGVPMDVQVFFESDTRLAVGDIVKNTSFFTFQPAGIGVEIFGNIKTGGSVFVRYIEEISLLKKADNKVVLQVKYIKSYGGSIQYAKLRPSLSIGPGYTILDWDKENYDSTQYKFVFEYNLNDPQAKQALQKVISNNYIIDFINIAKEEYKHDLPSGVEFIDATKNRARQMDNAYNFRLPKYTKVRKQDLTNLNKEDRLNDSANTTQYIAERLIGQENKIGSFTKLLWKDKDFNLKGHVRLQTTPGGALSLLDTNSATKDFVVTMTTLFTSKLGNKKMFNEIINLDKRVLEFSEDNDAHKQLREVSKAIPNKQPIFYGLTLTFNINHLLNILNASRDDIMREAAAVFMGEKHRNEWVRHKHQWSIGRTGPPGKVPGSRSHRSKRFSCLKDWDNVFEKYAAHKFLHRDTCREYYRWSVKIADSIDKARSSEDIRDQIKYLIKSYDGIELMPALQLLTSRLAGGYTDSDSIESVRYASEFYVEDIMVEKLLHKNGELFRYPFDFNIDIVPDIEHIDDSIDRVLQAKMYVDRSSSELRPEYYFVIKSHKPFENADQSNMTLKMDIRKYRSVLADTPVITSHFQRLPNPNIVTPVGGFPYYKYFFKLSFSEEEQLIIDTLEKGKQYNVLATVVNDEGFWVSEQSELLVKIPKIKDFKN